MKEKGIDFSVKPKTKETPSAFSNRLGVYYASKVSNSHKKENGQFFTPLEIAEFMASYSNIENECIRILDPGCGIGILSVTLIEKIVKTQKHIEKIELVAFETDINIIPYAEICFDYLRVWVKEKNVELSVFLCTNDFILHNSFLLNSSDNAIETYDIVISNPPYFKLPKDDIRVSAAKAVIFGQTNIYSIFLLIAAKLLKENGLLIFITPRSFCSGNYFRLFREIFFSLVDIKEIHLFHSRGKAFKKDKVLQENLIIKAQKHSHVKSANEKELVISNSSGISDIGVRQTKKHIYSSLIDFNSYQKILHLPISEIDEHIIAIFKSWTGSLKLYDLEISTGPVVDFRSIEIIKNKRSINTVPLIWLHNVESMNINWPMKNNFRGKIKGQHIILAENSLTRLVKNRNYVLVRRFSTKDDTRRLVAAPYFSKNNPSVKMIGIENHLNYIYSKRIELTNAQIIGLAAILNSRLFDLYFRTFNGYINVSATELRDFPLPSFDLIQLLGQKIIKFKSKYDIDSLVFEIFKLKIDLAKNYEH